MYIFPKTPIATTMIFGCALLVINCNPQEQQGDALVPASIGLEGKWRYDSAGGTSYDRNRQLMSKNTDRMPPNSILTISPVLWTYSGGVKEQHDYSRQGDTLIVRRIIDSVMVRNHYASAEGIGKDTGYTDTLMVTTLTGHRLVVMESTTDMDGFLTTNSQYYSR